MMYIALSYDHRIIDGKEAVGFLKRLKLIESPERFTFRKLILKEYNLKLILIQRRHIVVVFFYLKFSKIKIINRSSINKIG